MKFVLSMILCSGVATSCLEPVPLEDRLYDDVYSCMVAGYKESSSKIIEIGPDDVNEYEIYIKFYCKEYLVEGVNA